jgi:adenine deaminase
MKIKGIIVDIHKREMYSGAITISDGRINKVEKCHTDEMRFILPGLIDAHVHIESSMLTPGAFAKASVPHGTTGVIADPHEIANVLGLNGINYMINDGKKVPLKFHFGAPSCVPATVFETNGAVIDAKEIEELLHRKELEFLAEMMNFPGVINGDKEVLRKIKSAIDQGKPVDGHAPGLTGPELKKYINSGISTDHEGSTLEEAKEKLSLGMKIIIREGSAGRNLDALKSLFDTNPDMIMLGSDDIHPEMLRKRHLDKLVAGLINDGYNEFDVIKSVTVNPAFHYNIDAGLLREGDPADLIIVDDLKKMNVLETWIDGNLVFGNGRVMFDYQPEDPLNNFNCGKINLADIQVIRKSENIRLIDAFDGEIYTRETIIGDWNDETLLPDIKRDILKIIVKDRYNDAPPATGFIRGFGLKSGAFASSVAHDSHNIIAVGINDSDIVAAVNEIVRMKGGLAVSNNGKINSLKLDIAGIMTTRPCDEVADTYEHLSDIVKEYGCKMAAPFMTLSFMALLVIPELKLSDRGLFDGRRFQHVPLFID